MEKTFVLSEYDSDVETKESSADSLNCVNISYADIARKLIEDKLLLTALELHAESIEAGKEIPELRQFFSNPGNFENQSKTEISPSIPRSSSQATLDSLDFTRFSEDGERGVDERVAVLEFELRKARETVNALRADLTVAVDNEAVGEKGSVATIKPHESRALNFVINEYLLVNGYKLTSITFADENEHQDFEDWDDVGVNTGKPEGLLEMYRSAVGRGAAASASAPTTTTVSTQVDEDLLLAVVDKPLSRVLPDRLPLREGEKEEESGEARLTRSRLEESERAVEGRERESESETGEGEESGADGEGRTDGREEREEAEGIESEGCSPLGGEALTAPTEGVGSLGAGGELLRGSDDRKLVEEEDPTSDRDPQLNPGTEERDDLDTSVVSSRSEIDSTDSCSVRLGGGVNCEPPPLFDSGMAKAVWEEVVGKLPRLLDAPPSYSALLRLLSDSLPLISRQLPLNDPQWLERVVGLAVVCALLHPESKHQESLITCLLHLRKRPDSNERTLILAGLVAVGEGGGSALVEGTVLPQCCQLLAHRTPEKRLLAATAPPLLAPFLPEELRDSLLLSMIEQLVEDREEEVREACIKSLAVLASLQPDHKYDQIEGMLVSRLEDSSSTVLECALSLLLPVVAKWSLRLQRLHSSLLSHIITSILSSNSCSGLVRALRCLLPHTIVFLASSPYVISHASPSLPPPISRGAISDLCKDLNSPKLLYQEDSPSLNSIMSAFDYCTQYNHPWPQLDWFINTMLVKLLDSTERLQTDDDLTAMVALFHSLCAGLGPHLTANKIKLLFLDRLKVAENNVRQKQEGNTVLVPLYVLGVAVHLQERESEICTVLVSFLVALCLADLPLRHVAYTVDHLCAATQLSDTVAAALWQGVVDERSEVRIGTVHILASALQGGAPPSTLLPLLITLASDPLPWVRGSTLPVFSLIMELSTETEVIEKTRVQIQSVLSDRVVRESMGVEVVSFLAKMAAHADQSFREEVIAVELGNYVAVLCATPSESRSELAAALVDAYTSTIYCHITKQAITNTILPSLRSLEWICTECLQTHSETVSIMIKEMDSRLETPKQVQRSGGEEMRQRVSRIFGSPPNLPSIFKKK